MGKYNLSIKIPKYYYGWKYNLSNRILKYPFLIVHEHGM